jgi:hypothetical protein
VSQTAQEQLKKMVEVGKVLLPQILYWLKTGIVAKGKILHAGMTEARSIVRNKVGKKVEFGYQYLVCAIGGGYLFGRLILKPTGEQKMPKKALEMYQEIFTNQQKPDILIYDRGGWSKENGKFLSEQRVKNGIQPKGRAKWGVHGQDRELVKRERAMMEGRIGSLKSDKYKFNKPKERKLATVHMSGIRSILSYNLNKMARDLHSASLAKAAKA